MQAENHISLVGILHLVHSGLMLLIGALIFGLLAGIGAVSGDEDAMLVLGIIGTVVGGIMLFLSIPGIIGGIAILQRARWSRIYMIVLSALKLIDVPFGTALGHLHDLRASASGCDRDPRSAADPRCRCPGLIAPSGGGSIVLSPGPVSLSALIPVDESALPSYITVCSTSSA